jgi:hypothetical protein
MGCTWLPNLSTYSFAPIRPRTVLMGPTEYHDIFVQTVTEPPPCFSRRQTAPTCSRWFFAADYSTLKKEAIRSSETSVHTRSTRYHIPEDGILYSTTVSSEWMYEGDLADSRDQLIFGKWYFSPARFENSWQTLNLSWKTVIHAIIILDVCGFDVWGWIPDRSNFSFHH